MNSFNAAGATHGHIRHPRTDQSELHSKLLTAASGELHNCRICSRISFPHHTMLSSVPSGFKDLNGMSDEKSECRLYIGNLDLRITEATLIKMFSPFGKIVAEDFLWHTRGAKRGEPRGFAFVEFSTKEEAKLAKEKMHGRLACGRPLVVRLASEKYLVDTAGGSGKAVAGDAKKSGIAASSLPPMSRSAKIAAIRNKLKALEEEEGSHSSKKLKPTDLTSSGKQ